MNFDSLRRWFNTQTVLPRIIKTSLLFGIFGFVPGAWFVGVPFIFLYGLYKKDAIAQTLVSTYERSSEIWQDFSARLGAFMSHHLANNPFDVFKLLSSTFLFATMTMPFSFLGIYGLYRFTQQEWRDAFVNSYQRAMRFFTVGVADTFRRMSFGKALMLGALFTLPFAFFLRTGGLFFLLELAVLGAQYGLIYVGGKAFFGDAKTWLRKPISNTFDNIGKILCTLWGRWFAYEVFTGTISGSIGPAIGQVQTQGVVSGVIPSILSPQNGWFAFNSGYISILSSRISTFFNSIVSGLFFSHNMKLWGDFQGYIGPNSFQIFTLMAVGCLVGYGAEKFVDSLYRSVKNDTHNLVEASEPHVGVARQRLHQIRWHLAYTALVTPVVLTSPGGAQILAIAGGSVIPAIGLTAGAIGLTLAGIYAAGHVVNRLWGRFVNRREERMDAVLPDIREVDAPL